MVVLAGYQTVKAALVNHAEEFGDRDPIRIAEDINQGHGKTKKQAFPNTLFFSSLGHFSNQLSR